MNEDKMYFLLNMGIFEFHVTFQGCSLISTNSSPPNVGKSTIQMGKRTSMSLLIFQGETSNSMPFTVFLKSKVEDQARRCAAEALEAERQKQVPFLLLPQMRDAEKPEAKLQKFGDDVSENHWVQWNNEPHLSKFTAIFL